jgi:hypothetical protein
MIVLEGVEQTEDTIDLEESVAFSLGCLAMKVSAVIPV